MTDAARGVVSRRCSGFMAARYSIHVVYVCSDIGLELLEL